MLFRGFLVATLLGLLLVYSSDAFMMGDFMGEYRDVMRNCHFEGGYCMDPYAQAAAEQESDAPPPSKGTGGKGGRGGAAGRGAKAPPAPPPRPPPGPPPDPWAVLNEQCASFEYDYGCNRQGGICCYPYP